MQQTTITVMNQSLQQLYVIANAYKAKNEVELNTIDRLFDQIEESVQQFEEQVTKMKDIGKELTLKAENTALKKEDREAAKKQLDELNEEFRTVHSARCTASLDEETLVVSKVILTEAIKEGQIAGRRLVKSVSAYLADVSQLQL